MADGSLRAHTEIRLRTFVAIEVPEDVRAWIAGQQMRIAAALSEAGAGNVVRIVPAGNLHLTLRFLGDTSGEECRWLADELAAVALEWQPLSLRIGALGCFPNCRQPSVVWLGVDGDVVKLTAIQEAVELCVRQVGFAAETRPYAPHLTIRRASKSASRTMIQLAGQVVARLAGELPVAGPHFSVDRLVHMQSELHPSGSRYTPLATIAFGRPA